MARDIAGDGPTRTDVENWLQGKPREVAVILAARAALRSAPFAAWEIAPRGGKRQTKIFLDLTSAILRATAVARVAATYPTRFNDFRANAANAAAAAAAAGAVAAAAAAYAAVYAYGYAASAAADAAASAADDAAAAAASTYAAAVAPMWDAVSQDTRLLANGVTTVADLASRPLWHGLAPKWALDNWVRVEAALPKDQDWDVWTRWYRDILEGVPHDEAYELTFAGWHDGAVHDIWKDGPASANKWIKEHLPKAPDPPGIPAVRPATVEPILVGEIVTLSKTPLDADLAAADIAAALKALKARFERLLGEIERANIDPRFPAILHDFIDRLPSAAPDAEALFDMGAELAALRGYEATVIAEWPSALSPRYSAAVLSLDMTLKKFPKWREFAAEPGPEISPEQAERIAEISKVFVDAMRVDGASDHIDAVIPATLEALTNSGETIGGDIVSMEQAGRAVVARDELESINNILKVEASILPEEPARSDIVATLKKEIKEAGDDVKKGAKEARSRMFQAVGGALVFGPVALFAAVVANASGIPVFQWLLTNFKSQFGWLEPFLKYLNLL